jgi:hypothetical protein
MAKLMHAAGSKGRERVTSDQLKEFRNQVGRGHINRDTLQSFLTNEGDPLSRYESDELLSWKDIDYGYLEPVFEAMDKLVSSRWLSSQDLRPFTHPLDGVNGRFATLRYLTNPVRSFWPWPSLKLKPADQNVELLADRGIFWGHFESVQFVTMSEAFRARNPEHGDPVFLMFQSIFMTQESFPPIPSRPDRRFQKFIGELFEPFEGLSRTPGADDPTGVIIKAMDAIVLQSGLELDQCLKNDWRDDFEMGQNVKLFNAMRLAVWYHWTGQSYRLRQIRNFLTMYHLGNFPQGIYQNKLIVLCADK